MKKICHHITVDILYIIFEGKYYLCHAIKLARGNDVNLSQKKEVKYAIDITKTGCMFDFLLKEKNYVNSRYEL